jgi:hypothetical protein
VRRGEARRTGGTDRPHNPSAIIHPRNVSRETEHRWSSASVRERSARQLASSGKGWWRLATTEQAKRAMPNDWFDDLGLVRMADRHAALNCVGNRRGT